MTRTRMLLGPALVCTIGLAMILNSCGGGAGSGTPPPQQKIQHVVIIVQENRTPDNLFHDTNLMAAGADLATTGTNSNGDVITLQPVSMAAPYDLDHMHAAWLNEWDNGKMDGANRVFVGKCNPPTTGCPPPNPQFKYVEPSEIAPYFTLAETYTFGDRMFQTNQGPSYPAHQFILSGTSAPTAPGTAMSDLFVAENPLPMVEAGADSGCTAPSNKTVALIDPSGDESQSIYPCFDHPTLTDLLDANQMSWKYYAPLAGSIWTAPNSIKHMCVPNAAGTQCIGTDWTNNVVLKSAQVLTDIGNGQLATVTWVIPTGQASDHPGLTDGSGPSWVASVVNAIGNSQFWSNTAIIITWDDWGGWFDHVPPPSIYNSYEYGFRVPLIVVSPYAKPKYISHVRHDFGSILSFVETTFKLSTVDPSYADARADDLSDCFDFTQAPLTFQTIKAAKDANFFINDKRVPLPPDND
jgi:phospholipase C